MPEDADISFFDYCLIENLDHENSVTGGDLFTFAHRCGCPVGVAHTDLFAYIDRLQQNPLSYFKKMAENNIFWERVMSTPICWSFLKTSGNSRLSGNPELRSVLVLTDIGSMITSRTE